jgi:hypothetical protein
MIIRMSLICHFGGAENIGDRCRRSRARARCPRSLNSARTRPRGARRPLRKPRPPLRTFGTRCDGESPPRNVGRASRRQDLSRHPRFHARRGAAGSGTRSTDQRDHRRRPASRGSPGRWRTPRGARPPEAPLCVAGSDGALRGRTAHREGPGVVQWNAPTTPPVMRISLNCSAVASTGVRCRVLHRRGATKMVVVARLRNARTAEDLPGPRCAARSPRRPRPGTGGCGRRSRQIVRP